MKFPVESKRGVMELIRDFHLLVTLLKENVNFKKGKCKHGESSLI